MNQSTKAVLRRIIFIDENHSPLPLKAVFAFSDIKAMYPNVDIEEGLEEIKTELEKDPSPLGISTDYIVEGLRLCIECNCVQFRGRYYIPCQGCAQGTCHV